MTSASVFSRSRRVLVALAVALAAILFASVAWQLANPRGAVTRASAAVGVRISMKVTGAHQGIFKGDFTQASQAGNINVSGYQFDLSITPGVTSKRVYKPVVVTHVMGNSSPQFLSALATGENLTSVVINFYRTDNRGMEVNYYRVTLTTSRVTEVRHYTGGTDVLEDDSIVFRQIRSEDLVAHTVFLDNLALG
jgi:type VI secretion system secreted protein Hcp